MESLKINIDITVTEVEAATEIQLSECRCDQIQSITVFHFVSLYSVVSTSRKWCAQGLTHCRRRQYVSCWYAHQGDIGGLHLSQRQWEEPG